MRADQPEGEPHKRPQSESRATPVQWLNALLAEDAVQRAEPLVHHLPTTLIVAGPSTEAVLDRIEEELFPFSIQVKLVDGEGEWTAEQLAEWIERCDLAHQIVHVAPELMELVPVRLRGRSVLAIDAIARPAGSGTHCTSPTLELQLLPDGTLLPCRSDSLDRGASPGRLGDDRLEALWNLRDLRNLRAGLAQRDLPLHCQRCPQADGGPVTLHDDDDTVGPSDVLSHFGDRDLAPLRRPVEIASFLRRAGAIGLAASYQDRVQKLDSALDERDDARKHAGNLERRLKGILESWPYRLARPIIRRFWPDGPPRNG